MTITNLTRWPVMSEMAGVEVVTIPRAVYESLLQQALKAPKLESNGRRARSRLAKDKEVGLFVDSCLEQRMIYAEIKHACIERFGAGRAPSMQAISRWFRNRL